MVSREELLKALALMYDGWDKQNTSSDADTNFIYYVQSVDECIARAKEVGANKNYVLHRWYNYRTSRRCEYLFVKYGAVKEKRIRHHEIDIYINGIPYDIKLSIYPAKLEKKGTMYDLHSHKGKDKLIRWFYRNQSQGSRKHLKNKLFVVCVGEDSREKMLTKCDFKKMEAKIEAFMDYTKHCGHHSVTFKDKKEKYTVYADVIVIE